jgi:hypothetical protein
MIQRVACVVLELLHREVGRPQLALLTSSVRITTNSDSDPLTLERCIDDMLDFGSRYINIEATIGRGFCLAAGCQLPES